MDYVRCHLISHALYKDSVIVVDCSCWHGSTPLSLPGAVCNAVISG